jgi:hypothetical protein
MAVGSGPNPVHIRFKQPSVNVSFGLVPIFQIGLQTTQIEAAESSDNIQP